MKDGYSIQELRESLASLSAPEVEWLGIRQITEELNNLYVRNDVVEQPSLSVSVGVMVEVQVDGHLAYSATSDLSRDGLKKCAEHARTLAKESTKYKLLDSPAEKRPTESGSFISEQRIAPSEYRLEDFVAGLSECTRKLHTSSEIISRSAYARLVHSKHRYVTSAGSETEQEFFIPSFTLSSTAHHKGVTQSRTIDGRLANTVQMGLELYDFEELSRQAPRVSEEAIELAKAPVCPSGYMDLVLSPSQMMLQIHESIGHPLELDRILGDERNYAGWSFITPEDFGTLQYGSSLMNVVFDPNTAHGPANYQFDDSGERATYEYVIKDGILLRGLGGKLSQARSKLPGVACERVTLWNRPPIDRMANLNLLAGESTADEIISSIDYGVYMDANQSWSIDDYRNKFQFGCEYGRMIRNGKLAEVVRDPNYRGITTPFWNQLSMLGNESTYKVFGTPYCGKGEPNQSITVGHGSPLCLFQNIDVFGGVTS